LATIPQGFGDQHRSKIAGDGATLPPLALIAKLLTSKEVRERPDAQQAIRDEGAKQKRMGTWIEGEVVERQEVLRNARRASEKVHFARCFAFASDKNSEADIGSRIVKGRMVLGGDRLQDQFGSAAAFSDIQMSPTTAAAIRLAIAIGSCPGAEAVVMDASAAYLQAPMKGPLTYITLPKELWPAYWHADFKDPVVPLRRAMYGHPSSGLIWAEYCADKLLGVGFTPVAGWPSTFVNKAGVLLTLYVDDFLFAGKSEDVRLAAKAVSSVLDMGKTEALDKFLGCFYSSSTVEGITKISINMKDYLRSTCEEYLEHLATCVKKTGPMSAAQQRHARYLAKINPAPTPFVDSSGRQNPSFSSPEAGLGPVQDDDNVEQGGQIKGGLLAPAAAAIVGKVMYVARIARPDLLRAISKLARHVSCWSYEDDIAARRLMAYINGSLDATLEGTVGDKLESLKLACYCDSDYAGDDGETYRSTSGGWLELVGPNTCFPLTFMSKRQTAVSRSSCEAEVAAADVMVRKELLPMSYLVDSVLEAKSPTLPPRTASKSRLAEPPPEPPRLVKMELHEDNQAALPVLQGLVSKELRHMSRTHEIQTHFLQEALVKNKVESFYVSTLLQKADFLTKEFTDAAKWAALMELIGMRLQRVSEPN
jgi:hypothetical protein